MKQRMIAISVAIVFFLAAVGIVLYPVVSSYVNEKYRSEVHTEYEQQIEQADTSQLDLIREKAFAYNAAIVPGASHSDTFTQEAVQAAAEDYQHQMDPAGTGIMGYVEVPSLDIYLPIYHGTGADSLERGVGHLLGSSLPVGGESTHSILTGHSGMANQRLFTDLLQMRVGDVFYLHVLGEILAYQVDQLETVLPHDTTHLGICQGQDYCTLITCTPIGINTHRLLVRGTRIPYEEAVIVQEEVQAQRPEAGSRWQDQYVLGIWLGILALLVVVWLYLLYLLHSRMRKRRKGGRYVKKKTQKKRQ